MPRTKTPKNQRSIDDIVLEDGELAAALEEVTELEGPARRYRDARHRVKTIVQTRFEHLINAQLENGKPRYAVVDGTRFTYQTAQRPAGKKVPPAGTTTVLEILRLEGLA